MKSTLQRIEEIKRTGYNLDLGDAINATFENYKKIALLAGAVILLVSIVSIVVLGGFGVMILGVGAVTESFTDLSQGIPLAGTALIANLIISTIGYGLLAPVFAGIIQMARNADINEDFDFGTAFTHYKSEHFKELFLGTAIITLAGSGVSTLVQILSIESSASFIIVGSVIGWFISVLIPLFTIVMIPLIIFGKLNSIDAIKGSFVIVSKNFWIILLLVIIFLIFTMLGLIAICIGIFFTLPIYYSMQYIIYKTALPIDEVNELDEIGESRF